MKIYDRFKRPADRARDEVIIESRNALVVETLARRLAADPGLRKVAIVYGAAHHRDLERRILRRWPLTKAATEWLPAWTIRDAPLTPEKPAEKRPPKPGVKRL